ncbi:MAG: hypothetical protein H7282_15460 [Cytophagaceae bacterium]|nr:hypothetical protein [Cytophagaceae bacterium]
MSINRSDTSISHSRQLDNAIPPSKISSLSSGEFVGMIADDPDCRIQLKGFHCNIINDHKTLKEEQEGYEDIPVFRTLDSSMVQRNYVQIKSDIQDIIQAEMQNIINNPELEHLVISKRV